MPLYYLVWAIWPPLAVVADPVETSELAAQHDGGAITRLTNRLTGETYTLPEPLTELAPGVRLFDGPGKEQDVGSQTPGIGWETRLTPEGTEATLQQTASRAAGGVAGVRFAVGPLDADQVTLLLPAAGGVALDAASPVTRQTYNYPGTWGTPLIVLQGRKGGVLLWAANPQRRFLALHVAHTARAWQFTVETEADPPWETQTQVESPIWHIRAYAGDWTVAAAHYRAVMQQALGLTPLAARPPDWLGRIRCVVRVLGELSGPKMDAALQTLARELPPERVLLYVPHWRQHPYDVMYPDYTASEAAVEFVRQAQALGFRVMVHGNFVGISPHHPRVEEFRDLLQRDPRSHQPVGWYLDRDVPNQIYCLHPGSPRARQLLIDAYVEAYRQVGFDALHLDFPVIINADLGRIDGLNPLGGAEVYLRELQAALPGVPLGTEGLSDYLLPCSFAQVGEPFWNTGESWGRYHPLRSALFLPFCYLYGHLGIPDQQVELTGYLRFQYVHDKLGALPTFTLNSDLGFDPTTPGTAFALRQAKFWTAHQPTPDFDFLVRELPVGWPQVPDRSASALPNPWLAWRLADGRQAAVMQTLQGRQWLAADEAGRPQVQWQVAQGVREWPGPERLPGWLAYNAETIFGLDPDEPYLLEEGPRDLAAFHLDRASTPVVLRRGGSNAARDLLQVEPVTRPAFDLQTVRPDRTGILVDGREEPLGRGGQFRVDVATCGGESRQAISAHPPWQFDTAQAGQPVTTPDASTFGEYVLALPDAPRVRMHLALGLSDFASPEFERNLETPLSDGVTFALTVNGEEVFRKHWAERAWHDATVDLTRWRGQTVRLRFLTHPGPARNAGWDWAQWGQPRLETGEGEGEAPAEPRRTGLTVVSPRAAEAVTVSDAAGDRMEPGQATQFRVALPATLIFAHEGRPAQAGLDLLTVPFTTNVLIGGRLTEQSVYGSGRVGEWTLDGRTRRGVFGHPPDHGETHLEWLLRLPPEPLRLRFAAGVQPGGEAVACRVEINSRPRWTRYFPRPAGWIEGEVNLAAYAGQRVLLALVTDSVGPNNCDWAVWGEPRLEQAGREG